MTIDKPVVLLHRPDFDKPIWRRIRAVIESLGYETVVSTNGTSLQAAAARHLPDVILLAREEGTLDLVRRAKAGEGLSHIPILAVCVEPDLDEVAALIETGVEDCLRDRTPDTLISARIRTAVKTKYFYDHVVTRANEGSLRDPLTGLWNHRHFQDLLNLEVVRARRAGRSVGLLMLDLDRFKRVNDTYGHPVGDEVLASAAEALRQAVREGDVLARYGGEEFSVILPGASRYEALAIARRAREAVREHKLHKDGIRVDPTISVGVASFPEDAERPEDLIAAADMALYQAKRMGRDREESVRWIPFRYLPDESVPDESVADESVAFVGVGGDWNGWTPERAPLEPVSKPPSRYEGMVLLPTGKNRYKFKAKMPTGYRWFPDPDNPRAEPDGFGSVNSIVWVDRY